MEDTTSPKIESVPAKKRNSPTKAVKLEKNPPKKSGKENILPSPPLNSKKSSSPRKSNKKESAHTKKADNMKTPEKEKTTKKETEGKSLNIKEVKIGKNPPIKSSSTKKADDKKTPVKPKSTKKEPAPAKKSNSITKEVKIENNPPKKSGDARKHLDRKKNKNAGRSYDYFLVIDFEATTDEPSAPDYPHEIIEFPGVIVDGMTGKIVDQWRQYCRPVINPQLSKFCTALTGINQETVDAASTFPEVLEKFNIWLEQFGLGTSHTFALVTDGSFDVCKFLRLSCQQEGIEMPGWAEKWINIKKSFGNFYHISNHCNLQGMLSKLNMKFLGKPHSGLDDARNIGRVVSRMLMDGAMLLVNEKLVVNPVDPPVPPPSNTTKLVSPHHKHLLHMSTVSRTQARRTIG